MKLNTAQWKKVSANEIVIESGRVWLRASAPICWIVEQNGFDAPAAFGWEVDFKTDNQTVVSWPQGVEVWAFAPDLFVYNPAGEVFTNPDRINQPVGHTAEIASAIRKFRLQQRELLRELEVERDALRAQRFPVDERGAVEPDEPNLVATVPVEGVDQLPQGRERSEDEQGVGA